MKKTTTTNDGKPSEKDEFPGYKKYPASEDIMNRQKHVSIDADGTIVNDVPTTPVRKRPRIASKITKSESDVTKSDLQALNSEERTFKGDDDELKGRVYPVDFAGKDLDIPGADLDDNAEINGAEDEENNAYSLGGDNHNDLDEDRSAV